MISRNDPCWCGSGNKWKKCHYPENQKNTLSQEYEKHYGILIKTHSQIAKIKNSSQTAAFILDKLCQAAKKGVTTQELDDYSRELHKKNNAIAAPLGYGAPPFPKSICTSLNEVICHGIPDNTKLKEGDILNIDVTSIVDGFYGDCSRMVMIGDVSEEKKTVVEVSKQCLENAIAICKPGVKIYEIGQAIADHAKKYNCSVVDQFVGHGIGVYFHEPPQIPHHYNNLALPLIPGMTFTIEPMINAGKKEAIIDNADKWTARTIDNKPSAQWEHTLVITQDGHEVLTKLS